MLACIHTTTGRLVEAQSHSCAATLISNNSHIPAEELEVREVNAAEFEVLLRSLTPNAPATEARAERDRRISCLDWVVLRHRDEVDAGISTKLTAEEYQAVLAYRQALRDISTQPGFPESVNWPVLEQAVCDAVQQCFYQACDA